MIELYAIADHPGPPLPAVARLRAVRADGLAALCAPADDAEPSVDALWRHEEIVEALMEERDLLPVRYGTRLPGEAEAARAIAERHDELAAALDRVRGAVELSLRVLAADAPAAAEAEPGLSGTDYLRAKVSAGAARDEVRRRVHNPLALLVREDVVLEPRAPLELLRAAYLVDRPDVERVAGLVAGLQRMHPDLRLLCTGPWPPYSFAER